MPRPARWHVNQKPRIHRVLRSQGIPKSKVGGRYRTTSDVSCRAREKRIIDAGWALPSAGHIALDRRLSFLQLASSSVSSGESKSLVIHVQHLTNITLVTRLPTLPDISLHWSLPTFPCSLTSTFTTTLTPSVRVFGIAVVMRDDS